jgi:endonuclease-8
VCFNAPVVELRRDEARPRTSRALRSLEQLGPDLCGAEADIDRVLERLHHVPADTSIGDVLLDQRVGAGIGNVFKSEICWARRVHPSTPIGSLSEAERRDLYETAHAQLYGNLGSGRRVTYQGGLAVYGKVRGPCPRCRTPIRRVWDGDDARVTYWCPSCQPLAVLVPPWREPPFTV